MSDLPANRALDVEIAEKVFGLTVVALDWPCGYLPPCYWLEASETAEPTIDLMNERHPVYRDAAGELRPVPFYSTDLGAAWDVVGRLKTLGYWCKITENFGTLGSGCVFIRGKRHHGEVADTMPEAIGRAALATLGQKE